MVCRSYIIFLVILYTHCGCRHYLFIILVENGACRHLSVGIVLGSTCIRVVSTYRHSRGHLVNISVIRVIPQNAVAHAHNTPYLTIIDSLFLQILLLLHVVVFLMHSRTPDDPSFVDCCRRSYSVLTGVCEGCAGHEALSRIKGRLLEGWIQVGS